MKMNRNLTAVLFAAMTLIVACSSSSSSNAAAGPSCSVSEDGCTCNVSGAANSYECTSSSVGSSAVCCADVGWPQSGTCSCNPGKTTTCVNDNASDTSSVYCECGVDVLGDGANVTSCAAPTAGATCCSSTDFNGNPLCVCRNSTTCNSDETSVGSCAEQSLSSATPCLEGTEVTSCSGASSGGTTPTDNKCPSGPGKCENGDSSTCGCGESCVQTAVCVGCAYECVKGCATDADCAGYYSGDSPPAQLTCIPASSTMPTAHCGI